MVKEHLCRLPERASAGGPLHRPSRLEDTDNRAKLDVAFLKKVLVRQNVEFKPQEFTQRNQYPLTGDPFFSATTIACSVVGGMSYGKDTDHLLHVACDSYRQSLRLMLDTTPYSLEICLDSIAPFCAQIGQGGMEMWPETGVETVADLYKDGELWPFD
ncbi:hypothetical protein NDU88_005669 [Pleurodeles waltl]|uniref:Uncharacterized protein n=1 Tax=Pleurodeles waltl TaxID=8319 RepID=A0AAV7PG23_PLEWA|nr:hypothetical protein NDU88_005669 [Pleurodeles waltl]